ncbi:unnamed protein product, partial [Brenthis ino]
MHINISDNASEFIPIKDERQYVENTQEVGVIKTTIRPDTEKHVLKKEEENTISEEEDFKDSLETVSLKKKSESGGGKCGNARNDNGNDQVVDDMTLDIVPVPDLQNVDNSDAESVASSSTNVSVLKQQTLTSCLTNIKSFGDTGIKRGQITNAIVFMIAKDGLPLNTVEKTGFRYLMKVVAPLKFQPEKQ